MPVRSNASGYTPAELSIESMLPRLMGEDVRFRTKLRPGLDPVLADPG